MKDTYKNDIASVQLEQDLDGLLYKILQIADTVYGALDKRGTQRNIFFFISSQKQSTQMTCGDFEHSCSPS